MSAAWLPEADTTAVLGSKRWTAVTLLIGIRILSLTPVVTWGGVLLMPMRVLKLATVACSVPIEACREREQRY